MAGVFRPLKRSAPALTLLVLAATAGLLIWQWDDAEDLVTGALRLDDLAISISLIAVLAAASRVLLSIARAGRRAKPAAASTTRC